MFQNFRTFTITTIVKRILTIVRHENWGKLPIKIFFIFILYILMDSSISFETINLGRFIVHIKGSQAKFPNYGVFLSMLIVLFCSF